MSAAEDAFAGLTGLRLVPLPRGPIPVCVRLQALEPVMIADYKIVLYRQDDGSWVAEIPAISGCYALMPTRQEALSELENVFDMIADEYRESGRPLPQDTTEIIHA